MRVGIECLIGHLVDKPNNAAPFLKNFVAHLPQRPEHRYVLFLDVTTEQYLGNELCRSDFDRVVLPDAHGKLGRIFTQQVLLPRAARKASVDAYCSIVSNELPFFGRFKKIIRISSLAFVHHPEFFGRMTLFYRRIACWIIGRRADCLIANSESMRNDIAAYFKTPRQDIPMIYESVDPFWLAAKNGSGGNAVVDAMGIRTPYLLFVSSMTRYKNPQALLTAYLALRQRRPDFSHELIFVGTGDSLESLKKEAFESAFADAVHFTGYVSKEDLRELYAGADIVVHPSFYEATGNVLLQAMVLSKPIVAANILSIPEMVGDAALLFDPSNTEELVASLSKLVFDPALRSHLIERGRERASRFTRWDEDLEQFLQVVESVNRNGR